MACSIKAYDAYSTGSVQCSALNGCAGSYNGYCYPCDFWSGSLISTSAGYHDFWLGNGGIGGDGRPVTFAVSVRLCSFILPPRI